MCSLAGLSSAQAQLSPLESAEEHFGKGRYEQATEKFNEIIKNPFASPRDLALSRCRVGIIDSIKGGFAESRKNLEQAMNSGALAKNHQSLCFYALLQIYVLQNNNTEAKELVLKVGEPSFTPVYLARIWALAAEVGRRLQDGRFEVVHLQKLLSVMEKSKIAAVDLKILGDRKIMAAEVRSRLGLDSKDPSPSAHASSPALAQSSVQNQNQSGSSPRGSAQGYRSSPQATHPSPNAAGAGSLHAGNSHNSSKVMANATTPSSPGATVAMPSSSGAHQPIGVGVAGELAQKLTAGDLNGALALLQNVRASVGVQQPSIPGLGIPFDKVLARVQTLIEDKPRSMRVGLLVPVGAPYTRFQHRILKSVAAFANSSAVQDVHFSFHVRSMLGDAGSAEESALQLLLDDKVHVIIGPISSPQTLGALGAAHLFGVPVFALGPVTFAPELASPLLVRMGMLAKSQSLALVEHLQSDLHMKNAAILAPNDAYGAEMASAFSQVAQEKKFPIEQVRFYDVNQQVFQDTVQAVLGPQDNESRRDEFKVLATELRKKAEAEKRKFDPNEVKLQAKITFDALFIPESLSKVKFISSTFAFHDARSIHYLGDRTWADGVGKASIADQFLNGSRVPLLATGSFLSHLRSDLGQFEGALDLERQAFDALIFVRQGQYRVAGNNSGKIAQAMHATDWNAEGTAFYGKVDALGEPLTRMNLVNYKNGRLTPELMSWQSAQRRSSAPSSSSED